MRLPNITAAIHVGHDLESGSQIYLKESQRTLHTQIIGSTGRGKTQSIIAPWFARSLKSAGSTAVLICGKGDPDLVQLVLENMRREQSKGKIKVVDLNDPSTSKCWLNPLNRGSPQELTDRIIRSFSFEEPYYKSEAMRALLLVISLLDGYVLKDKTNRDLVDPIWMPIAGQRITFKKIYQALNSDDYLEELGNGQHEDELELLSDLRLFLKQSKLERDKKLAGLTAQLHHFARGELAKAVNGVEGLDHNSNQIVSLSEYMCGSYERPTGLIILLPTLRFQESAKILGRILLQELAWSVSIRNAGSGFSSVFLDEFSAFAYEGFEDLLNKARSYRVALHLSHQSLGDLEKISDAFAKTINTNTNIKCLLGLNDPETAEFFAKHIGTKEGIKRTERVRNEGWLRGLEKTGDMSERETESFIISPNKLKNFSNGQGILHLPTPDGNLTCEVQFE